MTFTQSCTVYTQKVKLLMSICDAINNKSAKIDCTLVSHSWDLFNHYEDTCHYFFLKDFGVFQGFLFRDINMYGASVYKLSFL